MVKESITRLGMSSQSYRTRSRIVPFTSNSQSDCSVYVDFYVALVPQLLVTGVNGLTKFVVLYPSTTEIHLDPFTDSDKVILLNHV